MPNTGDCQERIEGDGGKKEEPHEENVAVIQKREFFEAEGHSCSEFLSIFQFQIGKWALCSLKRTLGKYLEK